MLSYLKISINPKDVDDFLWDFEELMVLIIKDKKHVQKFFIRTEVLVKNYTKQFILWDVEELMILEKYIARVFSLP